MEKKRTIFVHGGSFHKHHIIPKCVNPQSREVTILTPREHYICHQILIRLHPKHPNLVFSCHRLAHSIKDGSVVYHAWIERRVNKEKSKINKRQAVAKRNAYEVARDKELHEKAISFQSLIEAGVV